MTTIRQLAASASLLLAGLFSSVAGAATVYCPYGGADYETAPTSGRYVEVTNAANPGECHYQDGNWDAVAGNPGGLADYEMLGFDLLDKNGTPGTFLTGGYVSGATSGIWQLASNIWGSYSNLYLGFHFGNGGGSPDSFIVELESGKTSGDWEFIAISPDKLNGLSNMYLFTCLADKPNCGNNDVPEPGILAILGLGLFGLTFVRRRRA